MPESDRRQSDDQGADGQPVHLEHDADIERQPALLRGIWHAPRGPVTQLVAWLLLTMIALALFAMVAIIVLGSGV